MAGELPGLGLASGLVALVAGELPGLGLGSGLVALVAGELPGLGLGSDATGVGRVWAVLGADSRLAFRCSSSRVRIRRRP